MCELLLSCYIYIYDNKVLQEEVLDNLCHGYTVEQVMDKTKHCRSYEATRRFLDLKQPLPSPYLSVPAR